MEHIKRDEKIVDIPESSLAAYIDPFSGAYNRSFLMQFLPRRLKEAFENNYKLALFMIDLDNFKNVNDSYGHLAGDEVIKKISAVLGKSLRGNDLLIRYAGDEFVVVLLDIDLTTCYKVAERLLEKARSLQIPVREDLTLTQTISMGFALFPDDAKDLEELIGRADEALYLVKKRSKNSSAYFREVNVDQISMKVAMDRFPCATLVDREQELSLIKSTLEQTKSQAGVQAIIFSGASGYGKTRLLKEAEKLSRAMGMVCLCFSSYHKDSHLSYFVLSQTFDTYVKSQLLQRKEEVTFLLNRINEEKRPILTYFIPSLQEFHPPCAQVPSSDQVIFDVFFDFMAVIVEKNGSLVWEVDNLHYVDLGSLGFFQFLIEKGKQLKVALIFEMADPFPHDVYKAVSVREAIGGITAMPGIKVMPVGNFDEKETGQMIAALFPEIKGFEELRKVIFEITNGFPFFVEELLKFLVERSFIYYQDERWYTRGVQKELIPHSLEEVIRERIKNLTPEVKETMLISSMVGESINPEILGKVTAAKEGDVLEILDKAKRLKMIKEEDTGFGFYNDIMKEAAFKELDPTQRKELYGKVSDAFMNLYKDNLEKVSLQLVNLFSKAEDVEKLRDFSRVLGSKSTGAFDSNEILEYLEHLTSEAGVAEVGPVVEIEDKEISLVSTFLRSFQGALKDFKLYPRGSKIRVTITDELYTALSELIQKYNAVTLSEIERSLVVNKRRMSSRRVKFVDLESIVKFMLEVNIRSISFIKGLTKSELERFLELIAKNPEEIYEMGEWGDILSQGELKHISVNEAVYFAPEEQRKAPSVKEKLESAMMLDFVLGKISGKDLGNLSFSSFLKENPQMLSGELMKAAEAAKRMDKYLDKLDILSKGIQRLSDLGEDGGSITEGEPKVKKEESQKAYEIFSGFDSHTKVQLIKMAGPEQQVILDIVSSMEESSLLDIIEEAQASGESLWSLKKLITKIADIYNNAGRQLKTDLAAEITKRLDSELEKKFMQGMIDWKELPSERKSQDFLKMGKEDLEDMPEDVLVAFLEGILLSEAYNEYIEVFMYLEKTAHECAATFSTRLKTMHLKVFKNIYSSVEKHHVFFNLLGSLLSHLQGPIDKTALTFPLELMQSVVNQFDFYKFKRKDEFDKVKVFCGIWQVIEQHASELGEEGVEAWRRNFDFQKVVQDLIDAYMEGILFPQETESFNVTFHSLLFSYLEDVMKNIAKRLSLLLDPFEKFVVLKKLDNFLLSLSKEQLEQVIHLAFSTLDLDDGCALLSYSQGDILGQALQSLYHKVSTDEKERILESISKLKLISLEPFLEEVSKQYNPPNLQRKISTVWTTIKNMKKK